MLLHNSVRNMFMTGTLGSLLACVPANISNNASTATGGSQGTTTSGGTTGDNTGGALSDTTGGTAGGTTGSANIPPPLQMDPNGTYIILLGTGDPDPTPNRKGPATEIYVHGSTYLVDFGVNVARQAQAASNKYGLPLQLQNLSAAFLTHLHSDHTLGLAELMFTPWQNGDVHRALPLFGPPGKLNPKAGIAYMTHQLATAGSSGAMSGAFAAGVNAQGIGNTYFDPAVTEVDQAKVDAADPNVGTQVYSDTNVKVYAFRVQHLTSQLWSMGYRFVTQQPGGKASVIVVSGDTGPSAQASMACSGCAALVNEVYYSPNLAAESYYWLTNHTAASQLGGLAKQGAAAQLVMTHIGGGTDEQLCTQVRAAGYSGPASVGHDLDLTPVAADNATVVDPIATKQAAYPCP